MLSQVKLIAEPWDVGSRRLPAGPLPPRLGRVERGLPRLRAALLAGRRRPGARAGVAPHRVERHLRARAAGAPTRASTSSTCHDGFTLTDLVGYEQQAQRGQRRGQPGRPGRDFSSQLGCGGPDRLAADPAPARAHQAQHARHPVLLPGRPDAARPATRFGRTPARQQQRLLPGQRDQLARTGTSTRRAGSSCEFTSELVRILHDQPDPAPPGLLRRAGPSRRGERRT